MVRQQHRVRRDSDPGLHRQRLVAVEARHGVAPVCQRDHRIRRSARARRHRRTVRDRDQEEHRRPVRQRGQRRLHRCHPRLDLCRERRRLGLKPKLAPHEGDLLRHHLEDLALRPDGHRQPGGNELVHHRRRPHLRACQHHVRRQRQDALRREPPHVANLRQRQHGGRPDRSGVGGGHPLAGAEREDDLGEIAPSTSTRAAGSARSSDASQARCPRAAASGGSARGGLREPADQRPPVGALPLAVLAETEDLDEHLALRVIKLQRMDLPVHRRLAHHPGRSDPVLAQVQVETRVEHVQPRPHGLDSLHRSGIDLHAARVADENHDRQP